MANVLVTLKKGTKWSDDYHDLGQWGTWFSKEEATDALRNRLDDYPCISNYIKEDYVRDGVLTSTLWFIPPQELHDRLFGPRFNDYGEIAP